MKKLLILGVLFVGISTSWACDYCGQGNPDIIAWCDYCGKKVKNSFKPILEGAAWGFNWWSGMIFGDE